MPKSNWKDTAIYKALEHRSGEYAEEMLGFLRRKEVMDTIETILDKGGTTPKDFTLHDADHSFHVAQRIWEIIPDVTKGILSEYELGLLLLSAYLHDIGMSPDFDTVERHRIFLVEKKKNAGLEETILSEDEINAFQKWIDNDGRVKELDIRKDLLTTDASLANYILSYYIRERHNDWSGEWISKHFRGMVLKNYPNWIEDLAKLCKSHHWEKGRLLEGIFDPKPISPGSMVHLRYLAICLRVADVMENDPERTPEVLLAHRRIDPASVSYWQKDKEFTLFITDGQCSVYSRPKRAYLHRAVEDTVDSIERELKACEELIRQRPLQHSTVARLGAYGWRIKPFIQKDIEPFDNAYVYIQGAFRPNTSKILELLGGHQLYGDSIWAYRELIQNAFDAVKERIAYQIVQDDDMDPASALPTLGRIYRINISLEKRKDGVWLVCKDQGVGMTKDVIEKFFLESGSSKRREIKDLERRCAAKGFHLGRTGQFGIGVLSYFMLADKVTVRTKRLHNTGYRDDESVAWHFEINGTHDFGELRTEECVVSGTEIAFRLKEEISENIDEWHRQFEEFLTEMIKRTPCVLTYQSFLAATPTTLQPGWTNDEASIKEMLVESLRENFPHSYRNGNMPVSLAVRKGRERDYEFIDELGGEMNKVIAFLSEEGAIEGVGRYRILIPYYKLAKGDCFFFLREKIAGDKHYILPIFGKQCWLPEFNYIRLNLKGIEISGDSRFLVERFSNAYLEIDFEVIDEKKVEISRHKLDTAGMGPIFDILSEKIAGLIERHAEKFNNCYGILNQRITQKMPDAYYWGYADNINEEEFRTWEPIDFPVIGVYPIVLDSNKVIRFRGQKIRCIYQFDRYMGWGTDQLWHSYLYAKFDLAFVAGNLPPYPICTDSKMIESRYVINLIRMPEPWNEALLLKITGFDWLLNDEHPLCSSFDSIGFSAMRSDIRWMDQDWPASKSDCLSYLLCAIIAYNYDSAWVGFCEGNPEKMESVFFTLGISKVIVLTENNKNVYALHSWKGLGLGKEYNVTDPRYLIETK